MNAKRARQTKRVVKNNPKPAIRTIPYSQLHWEIILSHQQTIVTLSAWRWIWTLSQVNKAFQAALMRVDFLKAMCANDTKPLIWKQKANDLFALTATQLQHIPCELHWGSGYMSFKETHLMHRSAVLELALAKHAGSFDTINTVFLRRKKQRESRKSYQTRKFYW